MATTQFSLRSLFICISVIAILCALQAYTTALALSVIGVQQGLLVTAGTWLAKRYPPRFKGAIRFANRRPAEVSRLVPPVPVLATISYLLLFAIWHFLLVLTWFGPGLDFEWYHEFAPGVSLRSIHTAILVALGVYLYVDFLAGCYGAGEASRTKSLAAATAATGLIAAYFARPGMFAEK